MKPRSYWQENLRLVAGCLAVWFVVSFGFGIVLVDVLNRIPLGGFRLGFWFAQQGSIYVFLVLIFFYAWRMGRLDRKHGVEESPQPGSARGHPSRAESPQPGSARGHPSQEKGSARGEPLEE